MKRTYSIIIIFAILLLVFGTIFIVYNHASPKQKLKSLSSLTSNSGNKLFSELKHELEVGGISYDDIGSRLLDDESTPFGKVQLLKLIVDAQTEEGYRYLINLIINCDDGNAEGMLSILYMYINDRDVKLINKELMGVLGTVNNKDSVIRVIDIVNSVGSPDITYPVLIIIGERLNEWPSVATKWDVTAIQIQNPQTGIMVYSSLYKTSSPQLHSLADERIKQFQDIADEEETEQETGSGPVIDEMNASE